MGRIVREYRASTNGNLTNIYEPKPSIYYPRKIGEKEVKRGSKRKRIEYRNAKRVALAHTAGTRYLTAGEFTPGGPVARAISHEISEKSENVKGIISELAGL